MNKQPILSVSCHKKPEILWFLGALIVLAWFAVFLYRLFRRQTPLLETRYYPFALVLLAFSSSELAITLSHHFGVFDHPTQARLFLLFVVTLSLAPFLLKGLLGRLPKIWLLLASASMFALYFPIAQENRFVNKLTIIRKTHWSYAFFDELKNKNILIIADRPGIYTIRPAGAVDFAWAKSNANMIREDVSRHLYDDVYVVEDVAYNTHKSELDGTFKLQTVFERQNTPDLFVRISKIQFDQEKSTQATTAK